MTVKSKSVAKTTETPKGKGREAGYRHPDRMRERIKVGSILSRAQRIADGTIEVTDPAVEAIRRAYAQMLLNKALPDLTRTELAGDATAPLTIITRAL